MAYESNNLIELKREALIIKDIETLRLIRDYEQSLCLYYKRSSEDCLRDRSGNMVELSHSIFTLLTAFRSLDVQSTANNKPGSLIASIRGGSAGLMIIEIGENTAFPIVGTPTPAGSPTDQLRPRQISGVTFFQVTPDLIFLSADQLTEAQLTEYLEITENTHYGTHK
jgi:hypothetical protein